MAGQRQLQVEFDESGEIGSVVDPYPHSLYLYLLRTVGVVGLIAIVWFFLRVWLILRRSSQKLLPTNYSAAIVRVGLLLIPAFMIAQITLEFIRPTTMDYAQFVFALMGLLVGMSDRAEHAIGTQSPPSSFEHSSASSRNTYLKNQNTRQHRMTSGQK